MEFTRTHAAALFAMAMGGAILTHQFSRSSSSVPASDATKNAAEETHVRTTSRLEAGDARTLATEIESLRTDVEALRAQVAQLRAEGRAGSAHEEEVMPSEEEQRAMWEDYVSSAEAGFNEEQTDARWATEFTATIQRQIANQPALRGTAKTVECHSKSCKVELRDDGSAAFATELPQLVDELGAQVSKVIFDLEHDAQGRRTQVLYLSRAEPSRAPERAM